MSLFCIADLRVGQNDGLDVPVQGIYGRKRPDYAIYRTPERVSIQFADDATTAAEQRKLLAGLNPLRGEINGMIAGWRLAAEESVAWRRAVRYDHRVADALILAFEGYAGDAEQLLRRIKADILDERVARARFEYLAAALLAGLIAMGLIIAIMGLVSFPAHGRDLCFASIAGGFGAFFSISLAIRGRTVLPNLQRTANMMDAVLPLMIGIIAAAVAMAFVATDAIDISLGNTSRLSAPENGWLFVLIVGFVAGFSERFVPDLLAKAEASPGMPAIHLPAEQSPAADAKPHAPAEASAAAPLPGAVAPIAMAGDATEPARDHHDDADGCACDMDVTDLVATRDVELPAADGGVATLTAVRA